MLRVNANLNVGQYFLLLQLMFKQIYNIADIRHAISVYDKMKSFRKSAKVCNISKSTIHRWWTSFYSLAVRPKIQRKKKPRKRKPKYENIQHHVTDLFETEKLCYLSVKEVLQSIRSLYGDQTPSLSWLRIVLKKCCISRRRFSTQRVCPRTYQHMQQMYRDFASSLSTIVNDEIVCLDEVSFCNVGNTSYGYFLKNKTPKSHCVTKREKFSVIMAITTSGVLCWQKHKSAFNKVTFLDFLKHELLPKLPSKVKFVLMDNVRFHHSKDAVELLHHYKVEPMYIPPYSPRCNPIEEVFSLLKRDFRSKYLKTDKFDVSVDNSIDHLKLLKDMTQYYNHTRTFLQM